MVAVSRKNFGSQWAGTFCGATLIHENWALTAAHCMFQNSVAVVASDLELYIGTTVLDSGDGATYDVESITVHPSYANDDTQQFNDIALLKLASPADAPVARLATVKPGAGLQALTTGWGRTNAVSVDGQVDQYPQELQEVNVDTHELSSCNNGVAVQDSQICAGVLDGGKDSCSGDSGGPLLLTSQGEDTLVGVVSYGFGCAQKNLLAIYTSVASYGSWIADATKDSVTNVSDIPVSSAISENYSDFTSTCPLDPETPIFIGSSGGGGSAGFGFIVVSLLSFFARCRQPLRPSASNKKA